MAQESFIELNQEERKLPSWIAKTLTRIQPLYQGITWERLKAIINGTISSAVRLLWITTCILIVSFVVRDLSADLVTIEPISVPKTFSEHGYTPEVASHRLRDALGDYAVKAGTLMQNPAIAPRDEIPSIVVPKIDLSLDTVISTIRSLLHYGTRRSISGELIFRGKLTWLRLRIDGKEVYSSPKGYDVESLDELFAAAVPAVMEKIRPYLIASTMYNSDPVQGVKKADEIIARMPASDVNVEWSYVLKGKFLLSQKEPVQAETAFRKAIRLNEANFVAHNNLGNALFEQGKMDAALIEFERATEIEPKFAGARTGIGLVFQRQLKIKEAIAEYSRAITLDPKYMPARNNLGVILRQQGRLDDAIAEFQLAVEIDPDSKRARDNLESALQEKSKSK
jgi:tetratricopeptide (TPR) repeat protein